MKNRKNRFLLGVLLIGGALSAQDGPRGHWTGTSDPVAARWDDAGGVDAERAGWSHHLEHGSGSDHQRLHFLICVRAQHHIFDIGHLRLLRAVMP